MSTILLRSYVIVFHVSSKTSNWLSGNHGFFIIYVTFTVKRDDVVKTKEILKEKSEIKYKDIIHNDKVAKVSIVGAGMVSTPGVTYKMFRGLSDERINILAISTSEIKLSVIIDEDNTLNAVKKLHTIFELD